MADVVKYGRGEIYWYKTAQNKLYTNSTDHVQRKDRPVLIISNSVFNSNASLAAVLPLTTKLRKSNYATHVKLNIPNRGESMVLVEQIVTVNTSQLTDYVGTISEEKMREIEQGLMFHLGLDTGIASTYNENSLELEQGTMSSSSSCDSITNLQRNTNPENLESNNDSDVIDLDVKTNKTEEDLESKPTEGAKPEDKEDGRKLRTDYTRKPCSKPFTRNSNRHVEYFSDNGKKLQFVRDYRLALEVPVDCRGEFLQKYGFNKFSTAMKYVYVIKKELKEEGLLPC